LIHCTHSKDSRTAGEQRTIGWREIAGYSKGALNVDIHVPLLVAPGCAKSLLFSLNFDLLVRRKYADGIAREWFHSRQASDREGDVPEHPHNDLMPSNCALYSLHVQ
jgi:hypothetical protein